MGGAEGRAEFLGFVPRQGCLCGMLLQEGLLDGSEQGLAFLAEP